MLFLSYNQHTVVLRGKSDLTKHETNVLVRVGHPKLRVVMCLFFPPHRTRGHPAPQGISSGHLRTNRHQFNDRRVHEGPSHGGNVTTKKFDSTSD